MDRATQQVKTAREIELEKMLGGALVYWQEWRIESRGEASPEEAALMTRCRLELGIGFEPRVAIRSVDNDDRAP